MVLFYSHDIISILRQRHASKNPIRVGLLGCGSMGGDLLDHISILPGIEIVAISARHPERTKKILTTAGYNEIKETDVLSIAQNAIQSHCIVISEDLALITQLEGVDVIVDTTGNPSVGAQYSLQAIRNGKHLVTMNVESDVTIGNVLVAEAKKNNVVYSLGAGDEPSATLELVHFVENMGFDVIAAGKGKNNPLNRYATPEHVEYQARDKNINPRMLSEFIDGTKTMVEMTALANAAGLKLDCEGMHGQNISLDSLHELLIPSKDGGILTHTGVVEYSVGHGIAPGVFVIVHIDNPRLCNRMKYLSLGEGPYYSFHRPYHLTSLEVIITVARAALFGISDMQPKACPTVEACGRAKRKIIKGEKLDGLAETCYYGWCVDYKLAKINQIIPLGLLEGSVAKRNIEIDEILSSKNVTVDTTSILYKVRLFQEEIIKKV